MYRFIAFILSLAIAGIAAWQVYINLDTIIAKWLITLGFSFATLVIITLVLYLPLLRYLADLVEEQLSTVFARMNARKSGLGLDQIPRHSNNPKPRISLSPESCSMCHGPGGPICESCRIKMAKK